MNANGSKQSGSQQANHMGVGETESRQIFRKYVKMLDTRLLFERFTMASMIEKNEKEDL